MNGKISKNEKAEPNNGLERLAVPNLNRLIKSAEIEYGEEHMQLVHRHQHAAREPTMPTPAQHHHLAVHPSRKLCPCGRLTPSRENLGIKRDAVPAGWLPPPPSIGVAR